ncbi:unnamed protein product [Gordionus sp. m RMFG-2023]
MVNPSYQIISPKISKNILVNIECNLDSEIFAKCEFFNAGGSVKDRIGRRMIEDAEENGTLIPGVSIIIEPTSGNTGIGLALGAAVKGYRCIIVMPEKMSNEKVAVLKALGAEIVRTPTAASWDSPESHIGVAKRLCKEIPNAIILDQYNNPSNPLAHYEGTAQEIIEQCEGKLDMIVIGAGTGGTIAGVAKKIKEVLPNCKVIGVDPKGSILALPESLNKCDSSYYEVEGIGYDFIPNVLDRSLVDKWYKSEDKPSFIMARKLIREEGLLCGGSCGSAMYCAIQAAKDFSFDKPHHRIVVILPDSLRNYITKFLDDNWMIERGFMQDPNLSQQKSKIWWHNLPVSSLVISNPTSIDANSTCKEAIDLMKIKGFDQLPIFGSGSNSNEIIGIITIGSIMSAILANKITLESPVSKIAYTQFKKIHMDTNLYELSKILEKDHFACIYASTNNGYQSLANHTVVKLEKLDLNVKGMNAHDVKQNITGLVTSIDLLNFVARKESTYKA